ncbi:MAG: sigma-54 dependent transcriptional regulator [Myxococcota bacterium]
MSLAGARILVVEDHAPLRRGIVAALRDRGADVEECDRGDTALARVSDAHSGGYDVVLTDLRLPVADGLEVLAAARARDERCSVLLLTAYGSVDTAVRAMQAGAFDFLEKPVDLAQLELRIERALEHRRLVGEVRELREERAGREAAREVVARDPAMRDALELARRVAATRSNVLITGETGTGKELIAGLIHRASTRSGAPLVQVNCAALPETLLESELFGHERGAFTGADRRRAGRFEEASGGTLFLDEIGELSGATQAKLLRVLQDQRFHRLGGNEALHTDARIVAATNRDLEAEVRSGAFREDLFFRLDVIRIELPPLRERPDDLVELAQRFLQEFAAGRDSAPRGFAPDALRRLRAHRWPGNVRELRNAIERAELLAPGATIRAEDLSLVEAAPAEDAAAWRPQLPPPGWTLDDWERALVEEALLRTGYVQKDACELLGISRRKLNYMIQKMGITHERWRRNRPTTDASDDAETPDSKGLDSRPR